MSFCNDCVVQLADGHMEFVGFLDRWWDRLSMWLSSSVSELLAFAYTDVFSIIPMMIQRVHRSAWSLQESHTRPQSPLSAWGASKSCCFWVSVLKSCLSSIHSSTTESFSRWQVWCWRSEVKEWAGVSLQCPQSWDICMLIRCWPCYSHSLGLWDWWDFWKTTCRPSWWHSAGQYFVFFYSHIIL